MQLTQAFHVNTQ